MSRLSIYETRWINLIFENRNQEYGAYQLRRESVKNSLTALFMGLLFVASIGGISTIVGNFKAGVEPAPTIIQDDSPPIVVTHVDLHKRVKPELPQIQAQASEATIIKKQLINPVIVHPQDATPDIATNVENRNVTDVISNGTGPTGLNPSSSGTGTGTDTAVDIDYGTKVVNTTLLDKMPEFPGGIDKFYKYVGNNFEKPEIEDMNTLRVYVSFVIEKDGSMTDIKVSRDPGYGLGREAVRVLKSLRTKWSPGIIDSKPVRTAYNLPIVLEMK